jgi:RNA polymerase sigma-70 factor (ECF subfamily)
MASTQAIEEIYQSESRRVLATLIRLLGDFDLAEEALQDAFTAALVQWPQAGLPANPRAWLVSAGRFKAIDRLRRATRQEASYAALASTLDASTPAPGDPDDPDWPDDRLRLIFTCCHPALAPEARVALTLREVCGLTTEEIAHAFLTAPATLAQRIVRAKAKIRSARIPYQVPAPADLPPRLQGVLQVIYLVFNEGYSASAGAALTRADLSGEAIRLGRLLLELLPAPEVAGLLALMLLNESRRAARATPQGDLIRLEDQDRARWDQALIAEGLALVDRAHQAQAPGPYALQAALAAEHARAPSPAAVDWPRLVALYDQLLVLAPSPVIALNRAVAVARRDGPAAGLSLVDDLLAQGHLTTYHLAYAVRADLCQRLGHLPEARFAYQTALRLAQQEPERRFLQSRIDELS